MARLSGKQILIVVGQKNYNEEEFAYLSEQFLKEGAIVMVAAPNLERALGRLEGYVIPHVTIAEANPDNFDAIVLIGGYGAYVYLWDDPATHALVQNAHKAGKLVAAASLSSTTLANAGILNGKKATVFPDYNSVLILEEKGARHVYENVVTDDNIITSSHPKYVKEFAETVMNQLAGEK